MFSFNKNNKNISGEKDLKEAINLRSENISIIAHQLRTRLSATKWVLAMFVGGDYGKLPQEQEVMLKKALEALEDSIKLSSELISINHAEDVTLNYDLKPIDIVKTLDDVIFDFSGESHKKNISIVFPRPTQDIPKILADEEKIRVVLQNIIENAIKYSDSNDQIIISLVHKENDGVEISIHDSGIGIPKEEQAHIFEKFYRASNAKQKEETGSGLGLYTIRKIVEGHHGKIWFTSDGQQGTTFYINIPLAK